MADDLRIVGLLLLCLLFQVLFAVLTTPMHGLDHDALPKMAALFATEKRQPERFTAPRQ
jgi:hypothetical protein